MAELYDPQKHGQFQPLESSGSSGQFETYDPAVHGEFTPLSETSLDAQTLNVMREQSPETVSQLYQENPAGFIPMGDEPGYTPEGPGVTYDEFSQGDNLDQTASVFDRRNWPAVAADVAGGVYEGARRLGELTPQRQFTKMASEAMFGKDVLEPIQAPEYKPLASREAVELGATAAPTFKVAQAANIATKALPVFFQKLAGTAGGAAGYALSKRPGEDRLVMGEDALLPIMGEIFPDADPKELGGLQKEMINDFADAMVLAYPAERAIDLGARTAVALHNTITKPIWQVVSGGKKGLEESLTMQIVAGLGRAREAVGPERQKYLSDLANMIKQNAEIVFEDDGQSTKIIRDTMSALEESTTDPAMKQQARNIREGELAKGGQHSPDLSLRVSEPSNITREVFDQKVAAGGGQEAIEGAGEGIQRGAKQEFEEGFEAPVRSQEEAITRRSEDLSQIFESDPEFAPLLDKLSDATNIDVRGAANRSIDETRTAVTQAYEGMKKGLDDRVKNIPRGHIVDLEGFEETLASLPKSRLQKAGLDPEEMTGDFRDLYENLIPELSKRINRMISSRSGDPTDLIDLRSAINEAAGDVPEGAEFIRFYREEFAPFWKDGKLEGFAQTYGKTIGRAANIGPVNFEAETTNLIEQMTQNPAYSGHLDQLLRRPEAGVQPQLQTNMIFGEVAAQIQSKLNAGQTLQEIDLSSITGPLEKYGASLQKINPEQAGRVNGLIDRIRSAKGDIKEMGTVLKDLEKRRDRAETQLFKQKYREFFDSYGDELPEQYKNFEKLFDSGDTKRVGEIYSAAPEDVQKGMQVAYLKRLKEGLFTEKRLPGGAKSADVSKIEKADKGLNNLFKTGEELFKDTPNTFEYMKGLLRESARMSESLSMAKSEKVTDTGGFIQKAGAGADKLITLTLGVLNRAAARARAVIKGTVLPSLEPTDEAEEIIGRLMADPEYAESLIRRLAGKSSFAPEDRRAFIDMMLLSTGNDDDNRDIIEQAVDAELEAQGLLGNASDIYDQTMGAFGVGDETGETSTSGRPLYQDEGGDVYSEKTVTFPIGDKWYTFPSVDSEGNVMSEDDVISYVMQNGPVDPVTGEKFPVFDSLEDAEEYAVKRSDTRLKN